MKYIKFGHGKWNPVIEIYTSKKACLGYGNYNFTNTVLNELEALKC